MPDRIQALEQALKRALQELSEAKERVNQLEMASDLSERLVDAGSFVMDWRTMEVRWSDNNLRLNGISREAFRGTYEEIAGFIHPEDRASFDATMAQVFANRGAYSHTHRIVRPNGEIRHVREVAETLGGPEDGLFYGITQDITEFVATKAAETDLNTMVQLAGEIAKVGGWRVDLIKEMVEITPVTASFHGAPELRTLTLAEAFAFYTDESSQRLQAAVANCVATGEGFDEVLTMVSRTGQERTLRVNGLAERAQEQGPVVGLRGAATDITDLVTAQGAAHRMAEFARMADRVARVGGWRADLDATRVIWSPETASIHDEPAGTSPSLDQAIDYYAPEDRQRIRSAFSNCAERGDSFDEVLQLVTASGRLVWIRSIGEAVHNERGQIVAVQGAMQDISDLVAARTASEALSKRLQNTLETISDGFFLLDSDWCFAFVNSQAELLLQHRREALLGENIWQMFPRAAGSVFQQEYERAVASGQPTSFREYYAPLEKWVEVVANPTPEGLAVYCRDITDKRQQEAQLRLLEAAVAHQNDILLITDAEPIDGPLGPRIIYVNDAFERRTGYSRAEVIGQTPRILQGARTQRTELDRIRKALEKWQPVRSELINYTKSGEEFWLELDIVPLADERGWFTHWVAIERDITERKQIQQALQVNEQRFSLIAKATGNAVWEWDCASARHWWSEGLLDIFGHDPDAAETLATPWDVHVHPDDSARFNAALEALQGGEEHILQAQHRFRRGDGSWAHVENRAFAVTDNDGRVVRILGCMTDISERLQLEDRLRQAQRMEAVGQLTGGVAHDFNNLLTVMLGNAEILSEELADQPQLQRLAGMSIEAADRGAELISRLLAFSRKQTLESRVLDVGPVVQGMDSLLRRALPESLDVEIAPENGLWKIELDSAQLESALLNLALNARDAMPDGGCLTIDLANTTLEDEYIAGELVVSAGEYVMIAVTDTGQGIAPALIDRIFEPFFTTKDVGKGSGLGLSMVYGFVKQSGGHIRVYSELGEGTSFKLYFPRCMPEQEQAKLTPTIEMTGGGHETILVVEDDSLVREHVTALLKEMGYHVFDTSNGRDALEIMQRVSNIDLLFTDIVMPGGMGGAELADAARTLQPGLKVLFTSGYTENSVMHKGRLNPGTELLSKPYRRQDLATKVRKVLDRH